MRLTASDIVHYINELPKNRLLRYVNPKNNGYIQLVHVQLPEGPIVFKRVRSQDESIGICKEETISTNMIWRIANAFSPNQPINFDRVLGASYNSRSVLESLVAHTSQFYYCYPGRIEEAMSKSVVKMGHKHMMWVPEKPHELGSLCEIKTEIIISEIPNLDVFYDALVLPEANNDIDIDVQRRHAQIQIALYMIGKQLDFRTWIAQNDKGIIYKNKRLGEMDGIISSLKDEKLVTAFDEAIRAASFIDCIWFKNGRLMPAILEVEHTTGITSGLTRMKNLYDVLPKYETRYVIVAPDIEREKVVNEANKPMFRDLNARFFPYSSVEELYSLCQRRKIQGVTDTFLDSFIEKVVI